MMISGMYNTQDSVRYMTVKLGTIYRYLCGIMCMDTRSWFAAEAY